jgi:DNA-binding CsgD family transcriptional regulator
MPIKLPISGIRILLLFTCLSFSWKNANSQEKISGLPFIRNFTTYEFKGGIQSWWIAQDNRDFIYIANNFGLLEYDGKSWNTYPVKSGLKVRSLMVGEKNTLYVGAQAEFGFFKSDRYGSLIYVSISDKLPASDRNFGEVWRIFQTGKEIYFLTFQNIYCYDGKKVKTIRPKAELEFSFLVNNRIYVQEWGSGLSELRQEKLVPLPGGEFFKNITIAAILPYHPSGLLVFTNRKGIYIYQNGQVSKFNSEHPEFYERSFINTAIILKDGNIAIGTTNNGLIIIDQAGKEKLHLSKHNGLIDRAVLNVYQDNQEHLWLAMSNGISMIDLSSPFTLIDEKFGLPGSGYAAIRKDNEVLFGTNNGIFAYNILSRKMRQVPNSTGQVYSINRIGDDYFVGHHNGAMILRENGLQSLSDIKGAWLFKKVPDQSDKLIVGTYFGIGVIEKRSGEWKFSHMIKNLYESSRVLEYDEEGNLWMAHGYKGIFRLKPAPDYSEFQKTDFYDVKKGFPSNVLINMEKINQEMIFPAETGIYKYNNSDTFLLDETFAKIFDEDEHLVEMEQDLTGNIYFVSSKRIGILELKSQDKFELKTEIFSRIRDIINDDLMSIVILDPKNILFGGKEGFIHYDPEKYKQKQPFKVHIRKVINTSGGDSLIYGGTMNEKIKTPEIPYNHNSMNFTYSSTFFEEPEKTVYQYQLAPFEKQFSAWTGQTEKEYTNLPEGDYTFLVKAKNIYGVESDVAKFTFSISPPWYRTAWAYSGYFLLSAGLLGFTFFTLDKKYKKERNLILLNKQREINQKENELKHLNEKTEQEIMQLKNEKLESEVDHMNRELTSSTIHLINKNELLSSVKQTLVDLMNHNKEKSREDLKRVVKEIDQNISSDEDWHKFERSFNLVHGDFIKRLLEKHPYLTPQEIKLAAYLRLNLNTKEMAQLLNISVRGVEISRYRLRKKLGIEREDNLNEFMLKF